jgi:dihydrofolate synthase/folylpolyglutamate synthase
MVKVQAPRCWPQFISGTEAAGYSTATYTSPHLLHFVERLQIQNQPLAEFGVMLLLELISCFFSCGNISLSYFEFSTLAALLIIKQQLLDVIILEVGMGGRLDAVNVVESDLAIITSIALDHIEYLGTDREAIGYEKAGIFRAYKLAICGDLVR